MTQIRKSLCSYTAFLLVLSGNFYHVWEILQKVLVITVFPVCCISSEALLLLILGYKVAVCPLCLCT